MYTLIKLAFKVSDMANKASSDYLISLCKQAMFEYKDDIVYVFAIVKSDLKINIDNNINLDFEQDFLKYKNEIMLLELDYANGVKARPKIGV